MNEPSGKGNHLLVFHHGENRISLMLGVNVMREKGSCEKTVKRGTEGLMRSTRRKRNGAPKAVRRFLQEEKASSDDLEKSFSWR